MLYKITAYTISFQVIVILGNYDENGIIDSKCVADIKDKSEGRVFQTSPELFYVDVLYLLQDNPSLSFCLENISTNQVSIFDINVLLIEESKVDFQPFLPSVIFLSLGNISETLEILNLIGNKKISNKTGLPIIFQNGYPNMRLYTILDWRNHPIEEFANYMKNVTFNFQMNNRLHVLSRPNLQSPDGKDSNASNSMKSSDFYAIKNMQVIETIPVKIYSITNPTLYTKYNFRQAVIKATAVESIENSPVVSYSENAQTPTFVYGLGVFDLWDLRDMLNFSVQAMKGDRDISANKSDGFKPIGIGHQLFIGEADVSVLHTYHLLDNFRHLKPLLALGEDRVYAIFRQPPSFYVRNVFLKPFKTDVWIGLCVIWTVITVCIFIFVYLLKRQPEFTEYWDTEETGLWIVAAISQRSFFKSPGSVPLKTLFYFGLCFSMIIYVSYSAEIISILTTEVQPIKDLSDLIANSFKIISDPNKFFSYMLKDESQNYDEYSTQLSASFTSELDAFESLTRGFQMHFNTLDSLCLSARELNYTDMEICELYSYVPLGFVTLKSGFYVQKNSPLQEPFNLKLVVIMERGLNNRYVRNYYEETIVKCPKVKKSYREDVGFTDVFTAFVILLIGMFIAFILLGIELTYRHIFLRTNK